MNTQNAAASEADVGPDVGEDDLNKAIEELRGVLHEGEAGGAPAAARTEAIQNNAIVMNIPVEVQIVLGSTEMPVSELMGLQKGSTVALNRRVGEAVEVMVNGRRIACGEVIVMEDDPSRFGIKLTEITPAKPGK